MTEEKHGIEEFRDVVKALVSLLNTIDETTQDGFQVSDIFEYIKPLSMFPKAFAGADKIPAELADYSVDERALVEQDISELDFESDYSEVIAEQAFRASNELVVLYVVINMARNKKPVQEIISMLKRHIVTSFSK